MSDTNSFDSSDWPALSRFDSLDDWLGWLEQLHPTTIELGLERIHQVACRLSLLDAATAVSHSYSSPLSGGATVVTVAGTNGKGSCIATLQQLLMSAGLPVATYTSPHIHHFCERICINGQPVAEEQVCTAFAAVDKARDGVSLTYFEFTTLAALWVFVQQKIPFVLLEVGLGGRLDAVNIIDADIAVITSIDLDHQEWLGDSRDLISREKLGIARSGQPLVVAEKDLTDYLQASIDNYATTLIGRDYDYRLLDRHLWQFELGEYHYRLPIPQLPITSVAAALMAALLLKVNLSEAELQTILGGLQLAGRFQQQQIRGIPLIYDVAHNPAAAQSLSLKLAASPVTGKTFGILAVMEDKDSDSIVSALTPVVDTWFLGDLSQVPRALSAEQLAVVLEQNRQPHQLFSSVEEAFNGALSAATAHDRIVIFGSFFTVAAVQSAAAAMG